MAIWTIAKLTIHEAKRRKIMWVAIVMGLAFLTLFGTGMHFIVREFEIYGWQDMDDFLETIALPLTMSGLYVTNFLVVIMSVLLSVSTISSEIESRLIDTVITKPMRRYEMIVGKWLGFSIMSIVYTLFLSGGVLLITYLRSGFTMRSIWLGMAVLCLNALIMMTVTIAGGTRLSTLANGVLAFMLYGLAFIGGWVELIGALSRNEAAVNLGILASLLMPVEILFRKAAVIWEPRIVSNMEMAGPFAVSSEPSDLMIFYSIAYVIGVLGLGIWTFSRRDL